MNRMKKQLTHFYDISKTVCLTSSPRSGSTWVAETLVKAGKYDLVDEPLAMNSTFGETLRDAGFVARTCLEDADEQRIESVSKLMEEVLKGRIGWLQLYPRISRRLLLKFVRLNRMMAFTVNRFGIKKSILLVRHPCAVVASQIAMHNFNSVWANVTDPAPDIPADLQHKVKNLENGHRLRALTLNWCLDQYIPIFRDRPDNTLLVFYENLIERPNDEWPRIFEFLGLQVGDFAEKPSRTASTDFSKGSQTSKWKEQLGSLEVKDILNTCYAMGVDFYNEAERPLYNPW